jgi:hypothetical protein
LQNCVIPSPLKFSMNREKGKVSVLEIYLPYFVEGEAFFPE